MTKLRVAVLRGGPSAEYDVSLKSGGAVLKNLPESCSAQDIFISKNGVWHRDGMEKTPDKALVGIDIVFNTLRGDYGEDGKVQKILDRINIPYIGSDALGSSVASNKVLTKRILEQAGIKTPYYSIVRAGDNLAEKVNYAFNHFLLPVIVKPATAGSSKGVTLVKSFLDLESAILQALQFSDSVIIEEFIKGREVVCGVIDGFRNDSHYVLIPHEIVHPKGKEIHDHESKTKKLSNSKVSDALTEAEKKDIQNLAKKVHDIMKLRHYSKIDMIASPRRGVFVLEANTQPSLAEDDLFVSMLNSVGSNLTDFLDHLIVRSR